MSTEHVVVPTEPCYLDGGCIASSVHCEGCLPAIGRRALSDQAVPVEQFVHEEFGAGRVVRTTGRVFVEVES